MNGGELPLLHLRSGTAQQHRIPHERRVIERSDMFEYCMKIHLSAFDHPPLTAIVSFFRHFSR